MSKNTSILLGDYFKSFIEKQIQTGRYNSASEVVRAALRVFEQEEAHKVALIEALKKGEQSGFTENFNREDFLKSMETKHAKSKS
ncbi:type II toxin-antitoxin system ParD family antitoxin [Croceimicrobium hydrocarbonivorans]|uniref:Type II toxin-antitoxin system ParD family antitoxin n=1 Tax=Croceimicrobium hydrocarbonivorans TaxID=2761580 RepID=A0A7H0VFR7_9FLAO|nr:type II toxin-antitoxin system ParD family antitoxin [Croceimicrobium hydrocarbonivorans]QNR24565.1 type II toxin-antitoxin system ParD family antitoxin [Croceimicrobium hydrocarbonivorans]